MFVYVAILIYPHYGDPKYGEAEEGPHSNRAMKTMHQIARVNVALFGTSS